MIQRIPKEKKEAFNLVVTEYKERVEATNNKAKKMEREGMGGKDINAKLKRIAAANVYLNTVGLYCEMNEKSVEIMNIKNDAYLSNARKNIYQSMKLLESLFDIDLDTPLTESHDKLEELKIFNPRRVLNILKKIEYDIALVEYEEGDNSKWKWTFVEMYGKFTALCKNMIDFKLFSHKANDPMYEYYEEANELLRMMKRITQNAAQKYRTKYELSTMDVADMNRAIDYMKLLESIHMVLNEQQFIHETKMTTEKWKAKLEADLKKKEEETKKAKMKMSKRRR